MTEYRGGRCIVDAVLHTRCGCTRTIRADYGAPVIRMVLRPTLKAMGWRGADQDVTPEPVAQERLFTLARNETKQIPDGKPGDTFIEAHYEEV